MKNFSFLFLLYSFSSTSMYANVSDTVFIAKHQYSHSGDRQSIYIDPNKNQKYYDEIGSFKDSKTTGNRTVTITPYGRWCSLYLYESKYYLYRPCDLGYNFRYEITKESITEYQTETESDPIGSLTKQNSQLYSLKTKNNVRINIYIVDAQKGIAVFEQVSKTGRKEYRLMVSAHHIRSFPLIVNNCSEKTNEFNFATPDYKQLISMSQGKK